MAVNKFSRERDDEGLAVGSLPPPLMMRHAPEQVAVTRNRILMGLSPGDRARLLGVLQPVTFAVGDVVCESGVRMEHIFFPTSAVVSSLYTMEDGATVEMGLAGNDGALLRSNGGGALKSINTDVVEMLLGRGFVPVIAPTALGDDGRAHPIDGDIVASRLAVALGAQKLIYLTDVQGILADGELLPQLASTELVERLASDAITGGMRVKCEAMLAALGGGVERVHLIDGRTPHNLIAELFTDRGVGTLVSVG